MSQDLIIAGAGAGADASGKNLFATDLRAAVARGDLGPLWVQGKAELSAAEEGARRRLARGAEAQETLMHYASLASQEAAVSVYFTLSNADSFKTSAAPIVGTFNGSPHGSRTLQLPLPPVDAPDWAFDIMTALIDHACAETLHGRATTVQVLQDGTKLDRNWESSIAHIARQTGRRPADVACVASWLESTRVDLHYQFNHPGSGGPRALALGAIGWSDWYTPPETQGPLAVLSYVVAGLDPERLPWVRGSFAAPNPDAASWLAWAQKWAPIVKSTCAKAGPKPVDAVGSTMLGLWTDVLADLPNLQVPDAPPEQQSQQPDPNNPGNNVSDAGDGDDGDGASAPADGAAAEPKPGQGQPKPSQQAPGQPKPSQQAPGQPKPKPGKSQAHGKKGGAELPPPGPIAPPHADWQPLSIGARAIAPGGPGGGTGVGAPQHATRQAWEPAKSTDVIQGTNKTTTRGRDRQLGQIARDAQRQAGGGVLAAAVARIKSLDRVQWTGGSQRGRLDPRAVARFAADLDTAPFRVRTTGRAPRIALAISIDTSGSMGADGATLAQIAGCACAVAEAVKRCGGDAVLGTFCHRILAPSQWPHTDSLPQLRGSGGTPTNFGIDGAALELERLHADVKLLVHFADGESSGDKHLRAVRRAEGLGMAVVGVFLSDVADLATTLAPSQKPYPSMSTVPPEIQQAIIANHLQQGRVIEPCAAQGSREQQAMNVIQQVGWNGIPGDIRANLRDQVHRADPLWERKTRTNHTRRSAETLSRDLGGVPACAIARPADLARAVAPMLAALVAGAVGGGLRGRVRAQGGGAA